MINSADHQLMCMTGTKRDGQKYFKQSPHVNHQQLLQTSVMTVGRCLFCVDGAVTEPSSP